MNLLPPSKTIITRPGFCQACADAQRAKPLTAYGGDQFMGYGSNGWKVINIPYWVWKNLRDDEKDDYINKLFKDQNLKV